MEKYQSDETFLARWAAGTLSQEEKLEFEKSDVFKDFKRIDEVSKKFSAPPVNKEKTLIEINEKISFGVKRKPFPRLAIAASLAIILAAYSFFFSTKSYSTTYGEQLAVVLPDGSEVQLNADSKLSHRRFFWLKDKIVKLEGEGFFAVKKGAGFRVETSYGTTAVLGTKFNVRARHKRFSVHCIEGRVGFQKSAASEQYILEAGSGIQISEDEVIQVKTELELPSWMTGISIFKDIPFSEVIDEIEIQYGVKFVNNDRDLFKLFSGSFIHNDLNKALQSTLIPMGIEYELNAKDGVVLLQ